MKNLTLPEFAKQIDLVVIDKFESQTYKRTRTRLKLKTMKNLNGMVHFLKSLIAKGDVVCGAIPVLTKERKVKGYNFPYVELNGVLTIHHRYAVDAKRLQDLIERVAA